MHDYTKYFKNNKDCYDRFLRGIYQKYKSLGKFSGIVLLNNINDNEAHKLSRLMGKNYKPNETIKISISKFIKVMEESKFKDFNISTLIEEYFGITLVTNKEIKTKIIMAEESFYSELTKDNSLGSNWLKKVISKKIPPYRIIHQRYNTNKEELKKNILNTIMLINNLPKENTLLSIYASTITQDPHYLDLDSKTSALFFFALADISKGSFPQTREEKINLLKLFKIEIDNLSNFVITYNLMANRTSINEFAKNHESLILNLQNISNTKWFDALNKKVYVLENPSLLSEVIQEKINCTVVISGGFPNLSVYWLLDKLVENNNTIYYNGDFDPEGLLIAARLKEKYQDNLILFGYDSKKYISSLSKVSISKKRIETLNNIHEPALNEIISLMKTNRYATYQENNKDEILNYIKENNK